MIDYFALALTHALIVIALLRILVRPDLDREDLAAGDDDGTPAALPSKREARRARRTRERPDRA